MEKSDVASANAINKQKYKKKNKFQGRTKHKQFKGYRDRERSLKREQNTDK